MNIRLAMRTCSFSLLVFTLAMTAIAQPQVGGSTCNSATLTGNYSFSLSGRDVSSSVTFSNTLLGVGTITFDGLSAVTISFTGVTNKSTGTASQWTGTYTLQANCLGTVNITSGDTASFVLGTYDVPAGTTTAVDYFMSGQDGTYALSANGNNLPSSCSNSTFNGTFEFNGNGVTLSSGAINGDNYVSGLMVFNGTGNVNANWNLSTNTTTTPDSLTGTYSVSSGCTATATLKDASGNSYSVAYTIVDSNGDFIVSVASLSVQFLGSGRPL
jgi:hypothetical protein